MNIFSIYRIMWMSGFWFCFQEDKQILIKVNVVDGMQPNP